MALLTKDKLYIKVEKTGKYTVYETRTQRSHEKKLDYNEVIKKYNSLIEEIVCNIERLYYDPEARVELNAVEKEKVDFINCYAAGQLTCSLPIITQYFEHIEYLFPNILEQGSLGLVTETDAEMYELVKKLELFGPAEELTKA